MSKAKRGRPSVIDQLRKHFEDTNVFPQLETIAASAVAANGGNLTTGVVVQAIKDSTDVSFGAVAFRNMLNRFGRGKLSKANTPTLFAVTKLTRGAPVGSCVGKVRNAFGRAGKPDDPKEASKIRKRNMDRRRRRLAREAAATA